MPKKNHSRFTEVPFSLQIWAVRVDRLQGKKRFAENHAYNDFLASDHESVLSVDVRQV